MTLLTDNLNPPKKKFFFKCNLLDLPRFLLFFEVCRAYRTGEIPAQSRVRLGVFFAENPQNHPDVKVLNMLEVVPEFNEFDIPAVEACVE